ncbi:MAG: glycosyltransferase [Actinomycetota bacterium]|nr:glycosyltransferase [Actinomycetota bacterium]
MDRLVSVLMPTFEQAAFLDRAVASLRAQCHADWELVVVDDGSTDRAPDVLRRLAAADQRLRLHRSDRNRGLGAALNRALEAARGSFVAYLPSDDVYLPDHLSLLVATLQRHHSDAAVSGVDHHGVREGVQLVQVMHRRTSARWVERDELETDDLHRLFWSRLPPMVHTGRVTCVWTDHPDQRHKHIRERFDGGLNSFRRRYLVREPLRFHSRDSWPVDEHARYRRFRRPARGGSASRYPARPPGLRILLVGELAFNPERVVAFEERGHELYGLWIDDPLGDSTVGPLPFGNVRDVELQDVRALRPDVVYGLLNWRAVPLVQGLLDLGIPVVWHFKEAPQRCLVRGDWPLLADLHERADVVVYATASERDWMEQALPGARDQATTAVLDGDLPKADWFTAEVSPRLSQRDGEIHTVCVGRPLGLDADTLARLGAAGIHTHLYGPVCRHGTGGALSRFLDGESHHVHVHPHVEQAHWVRELSRYDAGWLHRFTSDNGGDLARASWDDLNSPARLPSYLAAGLPLLQQASPGARVEMQDLVAERGIGLLYDDLDDLVDRLREEAATGCHRRAAWCLRHEFTFDAHVDRLLDLFTDVAR